MGLADEIRRSSTMASCRARSLARFGAATAPGNRAAAAVIRFGRRRSSTSLTGPIRVRSGSTWAAWDCGKPNSIAEAGSRDPKSS